MAHGRGNTIRLPKGTYSKATLADAVGVSVATIEYWTRQGHLPHRRVLAGKLKVRAYGEEALDNAQRLANSSGRLTDRLATTAT